MSNQKPAAASNPRPFAIRAPSTERSVYGPPIPARTCHIVHVWPQACGKLSTSRQHTHTHIPTYIQFYTNVTLTCTSFMKKT
eukprot:350388-Chlamydomonas_euryale.AAC.29